MQFTSQNTEGVWLKRLLNWTRLDTIKQTVINESDFGGLQKKRKIDRGLKDKNMEEGSKFYCVSLPLLACHGPWEQLTPFLLASIHGQTDVVGKMLDDGVGVNNRDQHGHTALHHASMGNHLGVIHVLIAHGADVNSQNRYGDTPLMLAGRHLEAVRALLNRGADVNIRNSIGQTALYFVGTDCVTRDVDHHLDVVRELIKYEIDLNTRDEAGNTPLHHAIRRDRADIVRELLLHGADANTQNDAGFTPLHAAFACDMLSGAKVLLVGGSENTPPIKRECACSTLHFATFCLEVLLEQLKGELEAIRANSEGNDVRAKMDLYTKECSSWKTLLLAPYHLLPGYLVEFTQNTIETDGTKQLCAEINGVLKEIAN
jgi:hypothetical protein